MLDETRIVIADDHPILRKGVRQVIQDEPGLKVVGEADDGEAALMLIRNLRPHVAILDLHMPRLDGFAVAEEVQASNLPVRLIVLTMDNEVGLLHRALDLGVCGYILKESALVEIVFGIRSILAGRVFTSASMAASLLERRVQARSFERSTPGFAELTPSERRILCLIAAGKPSKQIAAELHVHYRTVESHRANICQKLQLSGANSLLRFALEHKSELALSLDSQQIRGAT